MQSNFISDGLFYTLGKYFVVGLGLIRTTITAYILTKAELGSLVAVLLIFEYLTLVSPFGSINALNKRATNIQANDPDSNVSNILVEDLYRSTTFICVLGITSILIFLKIAANSTEYFPSFIDDYFIYIVILLVMSVYRSYAVIHNRIWGKFRTIISMEIFYALSYLAGVYFLLEDSGPLFLETYFSIMIASLTLSILISKFIPKFKISFSTSLFTLPYFQLGLLLMLNNFLSTFFWGVDRVFITLYLLPNQLAEFHIAHTWSRGVLMAYMALTFLFTSEVMRRLTFTKDKNKNTEILNRIEQLGKSSEVILALILIAAVLIIPIAVNFLMPKYSNINEILVLVLLGLMLKGLVFFPSSFMIANSLQKRFTILSVGFSALAATTYYSVQNYISSSIEYLTVSISVFLLYIIATNLIKKTNLSDVSLKDLFAYKRVILLVFSMLLIINFNLLDLIMGQDHWLNVNWVLIVLIIILYNKALILATINICKFFIYRDKSYISKVILNIK